MSLKIPLVVRPWAGRLCSGRNLQVFPFRDKSPTVALDIYAHLTKPTNQEAACRFEKAVFEGTGSKTVAKTGTGESAVTGEEKQVPENVVVNMVPPA